MENQIASFDLIILFFVLGIFASGIRSDLEIPDAISKAISIFLLLSLGLKGGHEVRVAEDLFGFFPSLLIGLTSCLAIPAAVFFALRGRLGVANASALSAAYGSVSAITFITAQSVLEILGIGSSGYLVAVMALMEVPAILVGVFLFERFRNSSAFTGGSVILSILTTKSFVLLIGGFVIGFAMNQSSWAGVSPLVVGSFKGVLAFFLIDLGIVAQKQWREAWKFRNFILPLAVVLPVVFGSLSLLASSLVGLKQGDQILMAVLAGSASYIAAPAAVRSSIPQANPSLYLALPLAITFPMNLIFGIPFYLELSRWVS